MNKKSSTNIHSLSNLPASDQSSWQPQRERSTANLVQPSVSPTGIGRLCVDLFLPGFTWQSGILWVSCVQVIVYLVMLCMGSSALRPDGRVLSMFGSTYGPSIQKGQIHRLVLPIFLHASIWHILGNVFIQLRMAFPLEYKYGNWMMLGIYFVTGIAGNLLSVALAPCNTAVGASTAGFGLIGIQIAELAIVWQLLQNREQVIYNMVFFVVMNIMLCLSPNSPVDWRGHLGGFVAGCCFGVLLNIKMENGPRWLKPYGMPAAIGGLSIFCVSCLAVIFAIPMSGPTGRCS